MRAFRLKPIIFILALMACQLSGCLPLQMPLHQDPDRLTAACDSLRKLVTSSTETASAALGLETLFRSKVDTEDVPCISGEIRRILSNPLDISRFISDMVFTPRDPLWPGGIEPGMLPIMTRFMKVVSHNNLSLFHSPKNFDHIDLTAYADLIASILEEAGGHIRNAFSGLSEDEYKTLLTYSLAFLSNFISPGLLKDEDLTRFIRIASKVDSNEIREAFMSLAWLFSVEHIGILRYLSSRADSFESVQKKGRSLGGEILLSRQSRSGLIVIGGPGSNVYTKDTAVIIDLGGDDTYLNNSGSPVYEGNGLEISRMTPSASIVIDVKGNDSYMSTRTGSMGSGIMGVGILMDIEGEDTYSGSILSQGSGFLGIGCLIDLQGNDLYSAQEISQGAALFGNGVLLDGRGDDKYSGAKYIQGFGGPGGRGLLLDISGNDLYTAGVKYGSTYGTPGVYHTVAQGAAWGLRGKAAGGVGILHDTAGDDIYIAGNFSQGTGYYLGLGVLMDDAGNDRYVGSRYCQGSAAHLAAGIILDRKGSDSYTARIAASQGGAWDMAFACALDFEGDDVYEGGDLAMGAAAQNAIGFFYDGYGKDRYTASSMGFGYGGDLTYEGGRQASNLGIFLDTGGCSDLYGIKDLANNLRLQRGEKGIFVDE